MLIENDCLILQILEMEQEEKGSDGYDDQRAG